MHAFVLAKSLPVSARADGLDALEFITLCDYAGLDVEDVTYDMEGIVPVFAGLIRELQGLLDRRKGAVSRTWPWDPKRLGQAVRSFAETPAPSGGAAAVTAPRATPRSRCRCSFRCRSRSRPR